jgi:hypothetical protein
MPSSSTLRLQIEANLANRIPSALTPAQKVIRPIVQTGVLAVDEVLEGGLPVGAITEMVGPECSGRTSLALSFLARVTQAANVCAWIDVSDVFDPESAATAGVDLSRLLWVRCGARAHKAQQHVKENFTLPAKYLIPPATKKGLHGGGFGPHPRSEVKGLSGAVSSFLRPEAIAPRCAEPQRRARREGLSPRTAVRLISNGDEAATLAPLSLKVLGLPEDQAETFSLWGIRTLGMLAALPERELIARMGQQGKRLRQLARGELPYLFQPMEPAFTLEEQMELDSPVEELPRCSL